MFPEESLQGELESTVYKQQDFFSKKMNHETKRGFFCSSIKGERKNVIEKYFLCKIHHSVKRKEYKGIYFEVSVGYYLLIKSYHKADLFLKEPYSYMKQYKKAESLKSLRLKCFFNCTLDFSNRKATWWGVLNRF